MKADFDESLARHHRRVQKVYTRSRHSPVIPLEKGILPDSCRAAGEENRAGNPFVLKTEGGNPTGSFKDRGMRWRFPKALEKGRRR